MRHFLFQWKYTIPAVQAMLEKPQDRPGELRKAVEAFGGNVRQFFFAIGECDGIAIVEFPDDESCVACGLTLTGAGANRTLTTMVLLSPEEGYRAMQKARETRTGYQAPVGYGSFG
jgi:uncharacterized protein with GYD domain